ncbi:MAG: MBL fold metallo-hydrolase [Oscillospiraceae bacterium]
MELTVLGNNGTCPIKDGACASYLLQVNNQKILIDVGNGSVAKLQHICDLSKIDTIIISHLHFDHIADLFPLKYALETRKYLGESISKIKLYIPFVPDWIKQEISTNDIFDIIYIHDGFTCNFSQLQLTFKQVVHIIDSFAIRIENESNVFVYSGDSGLCPALREIAQNANVFLCESTMLEDNSGISHHLSAMQAAQTAYEARVGKLLLTHFAQPYHALKYEQKAKMFFNNVESTAILKSYLI